jgi:hypothetical protein
LLFVPVPKSVSAVEVSGTPLASGMIPMMREAVELAGLVVPGVALYPPSVRIDPSPLSVMCCSDWVPEAA